MQCTHENVLNAINVACVQDYIIYIWILIVLSNYLLSVERNTVIISLDLHRFGTNHIKNYWFCFTCITYVGCSGTDLLTHASRK